MDIVRLLALTTLLALSLQAYSNDLGTENVGLILPEMRAIQDVQTKKDTFFSFLAPIVAAENNRIATERTWLKIVEGKVSAGAELSEQEIRLSQELARYYKVELDSVKPEALDSAFFLLMFERVDTLPVSLVLAQAANESAWGTSRFAVDGNNLFGQWCFSQGCGLVPSGREAGAVHEVKVFDSVGESVASYFRNLNTHPQYESLRDIRSEYRYLGEMLDSSALVWGLEGYSIRGLSYVREINEMIQHNRLKQFDTPIFYANNAIEFAP